MRSYLRLRPGAAERSTPHPRSGSCTGAGGSRGATPCSMSSPGTDCGSDHELLNAKFGLKLKKVGKTTRPFRYDLNQAPKIDLRD